MVFLLSELLCVLTPCKDVSHIGLGPTPMNSLSLSYFLKDHNSSYRHVAKFWRLRYQHVNLGDIIQSVTHTNPMLKIYTKDGTAGEKICIYKMLIATAIPNQRGHSSAFANSSLWWQLLPCLQPGPGISHSFKFLLIWCQVVQCNRSVPWFAVAPLMTRSHLSAVYQPHGFSPPWVICSDPALDWLFLSLESSGIFPFAESGISIMRVSKSPLI